ncbi:MAG: hypothetical protein ACW98U_12380 [Candidatus Thorarchaeota archaeon]|jgi:hypothetical protein
MMPSNILACLILELDTGLPLYSKFFDKELDKNRNLVPQKLRNREILMVHELGKNVGFTVLVSHETPEVKPLLKKFRERVEEVYKDGLKRGQGNFADFVILDNIANTIFSNE